jgi:hypothetical protein
MQLTYRLSSCHSGQFLERTENFAQALGEYQKSLTIEWNQPPIVEAVKRVQKKLNP